MGPAKYKVQMIKGGNPKPLNSNNLLDVWVSSFGLVVFFLVFIWGDSVSGLVF